MKRTSFFYTLSLAAGALLPLAFAPFGFYPIAILSVSVLLYIWLHFHHSSKNTFFAGLCFGIGMFTVGVSWVYISIYTYGGAAVPVAVLCTSILVIALSLFIAGMGYSFNKLCPQNHLAKSLLAFPALWVIFEWARTFILGGFPWLFLGDSQINTPLKNMAPIFGVYGVSFAVAFTSACIVSFIVTKNRTKRIMLVVGLVIFWALTIGLGHVKWVESKNEPIRVSMVQGNIPLEVKWDQRQIVPILEAYYQLSEDHLQSKLIIWPEAALPVLQSQIKNYLQELNSITLKNHSTIITGLIYQPQNSEKYYNAMISVGVNKSLYLKKHLVPFGEYTPLKPLFMWLRRFVNIPASAFSAGPQLQQPFIAENMVIAPFICYEIAYPYLALEYFPRAELLLTISEDSWFGRSIAAAQQLEIARMRSLELGRYQVVCANSGITAIINARGQVEARLPAFQQAILTGDVFIMTGITPWVNYGYYLWLIIAFSLLGIGVMFNKTTR